MERQAEKVRPASDAVSPRSEREKFLPARRAPVSRVILPALSKPYPSPRQAYGARPRAYGLLFFSRLVSILLPFKKIIHGSTLLSRARFLFCILFVDSVVNFLRFRLLDAEDVYQILNVRCMQSFQICKSRFHERHCLFFSNW